MTTSAPTLPFNGTTTQSRHASYLGAKAAEPRAGSQSERYLNLLRSTGGLTDAEAAERMGIERTSINARRAYFVKKGVVVPDGYRENVESGVKNTVWRLARG